MGRSDAIRVLESLQAFLEIGGPILSIILVTIFLMWAFIVERLAYFIFAQPNEAAKIKAKWHARSEQKSWYAKKTRTLLISKMRQNAEQNIALIQTLVTISPLLGLLGTVTGMISVFDVMGATGASDVRAMSAGVSNATITTMAGMIAAISGLIVVRRLESHSNLVISRLGKLSGTG